MTPRTTPARQRPGQPEAPWWQVLVFLAVLFGTGALWWAALIGVGWLVLTYTVAAGSVVGASAVVTFCVYLAVKGNGRARVLAAVILCALVVLVVWAVRT